MFKCMTFITTLLIQAYVECKTAILQWQFIKLVLYDIVHMLCYFTCFSETVNVIFRLTASAKWYVGIYMLVSICWYDRVHLVPQ